MDADAKQESKRSYDPRKDRILDIPEEEDFINQSLKEFRPPTAGAMSNSLNEDDLMSGRVVAGVKFGRMA